MNNRFGWLLNKKTICLAKDVRLREELWGGLKFHRGNGTVVDVDKEAFDLLMLLKEKHAVKVEGLSAFSPGKGQGKKPAVKRFKDIVAVLQQFFALGIVEICQETISAEDAFCDTEQNQAPEPENQLHLPTFPQPPGNIHILSAPETVHWAITYRCQQDCPDCYARRYQELGVEELDTAGALQVVENLAQWGVFQLAIGGGEPLQRPDLPLIARAAKDRGLVVHVTTGLIEDFDFKILEQLAPAIKSLHIGVKQDRLLAQPRKEVAHLRLIIQAADNLEVSTGANLFLCNTVLNHFGQIMENLVQAGFQRIIPLRYKPPSDVNRWLSENPPTETLENFNTILEGILRQYPHLELRLDCALSFLQRNLSPAEALSAGLRGCVAASRVMAIAADGSIYPCSQLMDPRFKAGDILNKEFRSFWNAKPMKKYRFFRDKRSFRETNCGACSASKQCGGCRVFAYDALGEDPGCGKPLFPPVQQLGTAASYKKSRKAVDVILGTVKNEKSKIDLVIEYLLSQCEDITPLALQKTLYYIQGFYYAFYKTFLFADDCEAWVHGPVYRDIYFRYRDYCFDPIGRNDGIDCSAFSSAEKAILDSVIKNVCCYSGKVLEKFTHSEMPWLSTRGELSADAASNRIIDKELIGVYFNAVKEKFNMINPNDIKGYSQKMFEQM